MISRLYIVPQTTTGVEPLSILHEIDLSDTQVPHDEELIACPCYTAVSEWKRPSWKKLSEGNA